MMMSELTSNTQFGAESVNVENASTDHISTENAERQKKPKIRWRLRMETWKCLVIWPPGIMTNDSFFNKMNEIFKTLEIEKETYAMRRFEQNDKKTRFEVCFESEENRSDVKAWIETYLQNWHARVHTQPELRMMLPKKRRAHNGRFTVMSWNANTITNKFRMTSALLETHRPTIFAIQETMRRHSRHQKEDLPMRMGNYTGFETRVANNSTGQNVRGLALLMDNRANLRMKRIDLGCEEGVMLFGHVTGFKSGLQIIVGNVYVPNRARIRTFRIIARCMKKIHEEYPDEEVILVGDWNESAAALTRRIHRTADLGEVRLVSVKNNLTWHRKGKAWTDIDHGVVSKGVPQPSGKVIRSWALSDHWPLHLQWKKGLMLDIAEKPTRPERMSAWSIQQRKEDIAYHNRFQVLAELPTDDDYCAKLMQTQWDVAKELKCTSGGKKEEEYIKPSRTECFLDNQSRRTWKKLRKEMKGLQQQQDDAARDQRQQTIKELKKLVECDMNKAARQSRNRFLQGFQLAKQHNDMAAIYESINAMAGVRALQGRERTHPLNNNRGQLITDADKLAEMWTEHFSNLAADRTGNSKDASKWTKYVSDELRTRARELEATDAPIRVNVTTTPRGVRWNADFLEMDFSTRVFERAGGLLEGELDDQARDWNRRKWTLESLNSDISVDEIVDFIKTSGRRKSPGLDKVTNEFLRCAAEGYDLEKGEIPPLARCIHKAIEYCWTKAYVPDAWNAAVVVPVPKKGDLTDMNNYRGIALLSTMMKVLNGIFAKRLMDTIVRFRMLDPVQVGFVSREEAVAQASCAVEILDRRRIKGQETYVCFIDLAKAYDSVPHEGLIAKAERFGIHGRALEWLKAIYRSPRVCCRKADGTFSEERPYDVGVRQGGPESPALFNVFMDDLCNEAVHELGIEVEVGASVGDGSLKKKLAMLLYADDIVCFADNMGQMRKIANKLSEWCTENEMRVNAAKCGVMRIKPLNAMIGTDESLELRLQGDLVPVVTSYTYLGVQIDEEIRRETMISRRVEAAKMTTLRYVPLLSSPLAPPEAKFICLRAIIQPTLAYGGEIWGFCKARTDLAERELMRAARMCFRLTKSTSQYITRQECGLRSMYEVTAVAKARLTYKKFTLASWLPMVLSGAISKHPDNTMRKLQSEVADTWLTKANLKRRMEEEWKGIQAKIDAERSENRPDRDLIRTLEDKKDSVVPRMIRRVMANRCAPRPNEESANELRYESGIGAGHSAGLLTKFGTERTERGYGVTILYRIRSGQYWTASRLARARLIIGDFRAHCPFCPILRTAPKETVAHWIFECPAWNDVREETLGTITTPKASSSAGLSETAKTFICSIAGLDPMLVVGKTVEMLGEWMLNWFAEELPNWNEEVMDKLTQFLARTSRARFEKLNFVDTSDNTIRDTIVANPIPGTLVTLVANVAEQLMDDQP